MIYTKSYFRFGLVLCLILSALMFSNAPANANPIIDFSTGASDDIGSITFDGTAAGQLFGTGIGIGLVRGFNTPLHNVGAFVVTDGILTFTSGPFSSLSDGIYSFSGGSFSITGAILGASILDSNTVLLSGQMQKVTVGPLGEVKVVLTSGQDTKNEDLLDFFGLPTTTAFAFGGGIYASGTINGLERSSFNLQPLSTDITNTALPEASTLLLLGLGLIGILSVQKKLNI